MFGIFARSLGIASRQHQMDARGSARDARALRREDLPRLGWSQEDMPFRHHAGHRSGRDD